MSASVGRIVGVALALALALCTGCAKADYPAPVTATDNLIRAKVDNAYAMINRGGSSIVVEELGPLVASEQYAQLSDGYRHEVDALLGAAALRLHKLPLAQAELRRASQSPLGNDSDRMSWLEAAQLMNDFSDAYTAFGSLRSHDSELEHAMDDQSIFDIDQGFGALSDPKPQLEWEGYLERYSWRDRGDRVSFENVRLNYATNLLDDGQFATASKVAEDLTEPDALVQVSADRRFDAIRAKDPGRFDPVASTERRLARFETQARAEPTSLEWQTAVVSELIRLNRLTEALAVLHKAMSIANEDASPAWSHRLAVTQESYLLFVLGRRDEALGVAEGAACSVCGSSADSVLRQATWLIDLGRGGEALERLEPIVAKDLPPWTHARLAALTICAAAQSGARASIPDQMTYLGNHRLEDPWALIDAELCLDDQDGAARATSSGLADPRQRDRVLRRLQIFLPGPEATPWQAQMSRRLDALRVRPDVAAAVGRVGRIEKVALFDSDED